MFTKITIKEFLAKVINNYPRFFKLIGFKAIRPDEPDERDDIMGAEERFDWKVLKEDGDWVEAFKNIDWEVQFWMDCSGHGAKNIIEDLAWIKWNEKWHISEAYINGMAGTSMWRGNSMRVILQTIRKYGIVSDNDWPAENRWKKIPQKIIDKGIAWTKEYNFGYDTVWPTDRLLKEAIKFSPLYVGGYAWYPKGMLYYSVGKANHAFTCLRMLPKIAGDSYKPHIKHLAETYKFAYAKRIYLERKDYRYNEERIKKYLDNGTWYLIRGDAKGEFYKILEKELLHIPTKKRISEIIAEDTGQTLEIDLLELTKEKKLKWITENEFNNLIL